MLYRLWLPQDCFMRNFYFLWNNQSNNQSIHRSMQSDFLRKNDSYRIPYSTGISVP